mmetsp:Transcript_16562/g.19844  ORF Transcript_16562/g.19844 Transcript_16562/m.19844 type:complete len:486 (-) Transcript_16562:111-1568(-)
MTAPQTSILIPEPRSGLELNSESLPVALKKSVEILLHKGTKVRDSFDTRDLAVTLDREDPLGEFRQEFLFPVVKSPDCRFGIKKKGEATVYLCGNSLGLQPKQTREYVEEELKKWETLGVDGHFSKVRPWVTIDELCVDNMAKIVGAKSLEVCIMNSLTVNLHLMMVSFYRPNAQRYKVIIEGKSFPSDYIAVVSQIREKGYDPETALIKVYPRKGEHTLLTTDIKAAIRENADELALVLIGGLQYYTGQAFEIEKIVKATREVAPNANVGIDLAHAVGNIPLQLHDWGVDFACWCTYKYLNSGPGSIGGCFVHERHANKGTEIPRFAGWWGHRKEDRFDMAETFIPTPGAFGWQLSNPPVLPLAALRASLDIFARAGMAGLRTKSISLTRYLELLLELQLPEGMCKVITPGYDRAEERGCQLSLTFFFPMEKVHSVIEREGVICDLRKPNVMRIAPCPLYNSYCDVFDFVQILKKAIEDCKDGI